MTGAVDGIGVKNVQSAERLRPYNRPPLKARRFYPYWSYNFRSSISIYHIKSRFQFGLTVRVDCDHITIHRTDFHTVWQNRFGPLRSFNQAQANVFKYNCNSTLIFWPPPQLFYRKFKSPPPFWSFIYTYSPPPFINNNRFILRNIRFRIKYCLFVIICLCYAGSICDFNELDF